jgi:hypothetical protein
MSNTPIGNSKPKLDLQKLTTDLAQGFDNPSNVVGSSGVSGDDIAELSPRFAQTRYETIYHGKHDSSIVLGRDRIGVFDGYGINGNTSCAAVDIVVGRKSSDDKFDIKQQIAYPDFTTDAARIYVSQKSDIDKAFGLPAGKGGLSVARSAIALKADGLRLIGRENLKLVVGTDQKNSQGGNINTRVGVELLAGKIEDGDRLMIIEDDAESQISEIESGGMQPIPLGINTAFAIDQLTEKVDKLSGVVSTAAMIIIDYMNEMAYHSHRNLLNEYFGIPVLPSEQAIYASTSAAAQLLQYTIADIKLFRMELISYKNNHLKPAGAYYINSKYHSLN